jgi:hypothetical protein
MSVQIVGPTTHLDGHTDPFHGPEESGPVPTSISAHDQDIIPVRFAGGAEHFVVDAKWEVPDAVRR